LNNTPQTAMPTPLDLAFALLFTVVITVFDTLVFVPRFKAAANAGVPDARRNAYRRTIIGQWAFTAAAIALWVRAGRSWTQLGVAPSNSYGVIASLGIVTLMSALMIQQFRAIRRTTPEARVALRSKLEYVEYLMPHTRREFRWFSALSVTAGVCEELLFRGYLLWLLKAYIGTAGAALLGVVLFGALHIYQGRKGAVKAALAGGVMTGIVLTTGWLFPAMVIHALVDLSAGVLGVTVLGGQPPQYDATKPLPIAS
jgi:membrane protease YdiL (CAAX protease family)